MCPLACFEAGRLTSIQSSWTALARSRKWMSGHAAALVAVLVQFITDRVRRITAQAASLLFDVSALGSSFREHGGDVCFSLDKSLSWMSYYSDMTSARTISIGVSGILRISFERSIPASVWSSLVTVLGSMIQTRGTPLASKSRVFCQTS